MGNPRPTLSLPAPKSTTWARLTSWCQIEGALKIFKIWFFFFHILVAEKHTSSNELRAIFIDSLIHKTFIQHSSLDGSNETQIIMRNLKT